MQRFKLLAIIAVALSAGFMTLQSNAAILQGALTGGQNFINDVDADKFFTDTNGNGLIDPTDVIETVVIFDNISNAVFGGTTLDVATGTPTYQLTAHILSTVASKTYVSGSGANSIYAFSFVPTVVDIYEDANTLSNTIIPSFATQSAAATIAMATDGSLILSLSTAGTGKNLTPDAWNAVGKDDFALLSGSNRAFFTAALSIVGANSLGILTDAEFSDSTSFPNGTGDFHDVVAFGDVFAATPAVKAQGWLAQSNATVVFEVVPEPISVVVWSLLIGCCAFPKRALRAR